MTCTPIHGAHDKEVSQSSGGCKLCPHFLEQARCLRALQPGDIVLVRVYYSYPLILPNMFGTVANLPDNHRLIQSSTVFRNEPYDD